MHRRFLAVAALTGATLLLLSTVGFSSAGESAGIPKAAISTAGPIDRLAADGTTVAAVVGTNGTGCREQTLIWDVRRQTPVFMQERGDFDATADDFCPPELADTDLALAVGGGMVGVLRFADVDHDENSTLSVTRLPTNGRWTDIAAVWEYEYGAGEGDYLSVLGDGPILAFGKWTVCYVYNPSSDTCPGVSTGGGWWVSDGQLARILSPGSTKAIGTGPSFVRAVALDRGRFLVLPPRANVSIISTSDGRVTELPIPTRTIRQADLDGNNLLILRRGTPGTVVLDVRDASTGVLRNSWPLSKAPIKPSTVELEDAHAGIAVYRIGTTIHILRVTDGKSHAIAIPGNQGPVHARLEDPGLIYSFTTPGKKPGGRIEFVPLAHLLARLR